MNIAEFAEFTEFAEFRVLWRYHICSHKLNSAIVVSKDAQTPYDVATFNLQSCIFNT